MSEKYITIMAQGFYGNNVITEINVKNIDRFILGILNDEIKLYPDEKIDRSIIKIPNTENLIIIYNKYEEESGIKDNIKITALIPELGINLHSRCIACRIDNDGNIDSLLPEDVDTVLKYFPKKSI